MIAEWIMAVLLVGTTIYTGIVYGRAYNPRAELVNDGPRCGTPMLYGIPRPCVRPRDHDGYCSPW